jgi:flagellum-specific peptidoglycan hydrolase FlgJ
VALPTPKDANKVSYFRKYSSVQDSVKDHSDFLKKQGRYAKAGLFNARNYSEQIDSLVKGKYAESKDYAKTLNSIIDKYNLVDLDKEARIRSGQMNNTIAIIVTVVIGVVLYKILNKKLKTWKL